MQPIDFNVREAILEANGNIVISASAGTGKTYTTVLKIIQEEQKSIDYHTFAAITFTRKAAKEIYTRLGNNIGEGFVGTNDNFVLNEIIQPFMYDVYGNDFKRVISPDYSNEKSFNSFEQGVEVIKHEGFLCKFRDNHLNFAFQLALNILNFSKAARQYLNAKYYRIYIDEYQDCDVDMHNLFMYICKEIRIPVFIVGDVKQSIYGWRGGYVKGFKQIISDVEIFNVFKLKHNFRSNIAIQNYSNLFMDDVRENYQLNEFTDEIIGYAYKNANYAIKYISEWLTPSEDCAFLVRRNDDARVWSELLNIAGMDFVHLPASPLDNTNMESEHVWVARTLAFYVLQERFSEYDVVSEIPSSDAYIFNDIRRILIAIKENIMYKSVFEEKCLMFYEYLGFKTDEKIKNEIQVLFTIICDAQYVATYNPKKYKHVITTIHSSKGLEYEQVIIQASDYNLKSEDDKYLHYVAVSRPKSQLLVIINYNNFNGKNYVKEIKCDIEKTKALGFDLGTDNVIRGINSSEFLH